MPVARGADGAPAYSLTCPPDTPYSKGLSCTGRLKLERVTLPGASGPPEVLGSTDFTIPARGRSVVPVELTAAGAGELARPHALVAVHVLFGGAVFRDQQLPTPDELWDAPWADIGWQQRLNRP